MLTIKVDRNRISPSFKATVNVQSDKPIMAYEARATKSGEAFGRGVGFDLLSDDASASNGVVTLSSSVTSFSFDIESTELSSDGSYRISVFVKDVNGVWNDCSALYTSASQPVRDSSGAYVLAKRSGSGTDTTYKSAYTGNQINNFVSEVLS